jgi:hypothetical protein
MKALIDLLHILLCQQEHTYDVMRITTRQPHDSYCYFYIENDIADGESMPDHVQWKSITDKFKTSLSLRSDEEAINFLRDLIKLSQDSKKLSGGNINRLQFIQSILS